MPPSTRKGSIETEFTSAQPTTYHAACLNGEKLLAPMADAQSTVYIILNHQVHMVHRDLLCHYSTYFRSVLSFQRPIYKKVPNSNIEICIRLPPPSPYFHLPREHQIEEQVLDVFMSWLYHGFSLFNSGVVSAEILIQLWVFAARIGCANCQNDCIEGIEQCRVRDGIIQTTWISWIYRHTLGHCGLRRLLVDQCAWNLSTEYFLWHPLVFPPQFLLDVLVATRRCLMGAAPTADHGAWEALGGPPFGGNRARRTTYWVCDDTEGLRRGS